MNICQTAVSHCTAVFAHSVLVFHLISSYIFYFRRVSSVFFFELPASGASLKHTMSSLGIFA